MKLILTKSEIIKSKNRKQFVNDRLAEAGFDVSGNDIKVEERPKSYLFLQGGEEDAERTDGTSTEENTG